MKKIYSVILTILAISLSSPALAAIFLQNNYGAPIQYVQEPASRAHLYDAKTIGNGARAELRPQGVSARNFFDQPQQFLSIRSIGGSYSDLSHLVAQVESQEKNHRNEHALIVIYPRQGLYGIYNWNAVIEWEQIKR